MDHLPFVTKLLHGMPWVLLGAGLMLAALYRPLSKARNRVVDAARRANAKLREEESRFRAMTRAMPDLVMVLDEDGRYLDLHTIDEGRLAQPRSAMLGRTASECLPPESARFIQDTVTRALQSPEVLTVEYPLDVQAGNLWLEARVAAMDQAINGKRCVVWVSRNITARRKQEEYLRQSQKLESLGVLAGGVAHDFNNLLMTMQGNINLAQMHLSPDSQLFKYFSKTETAIRKASELASQMLAYSGQAELNMQDLDLNQLVEDMAGLLRATVSRKIKLNLDLEKGMPRFRGDVVQIQQVIVNLVTNSVEAIGDADGQIDVVTEAQELSSSFIAEHLPTQVLPPGPYLSLCISDTGCGMDAGLLGRIFDPFFSTKSLGRGLGLSTLLGTLRSHRAGVLIQTRPGQGSQFTLFFPVVSSPALAVDAVAEGSAPALTPRRILVVDDEPGVREAIREMLESEGLSVTEAGNGLVALNCLDAGSPVDVVLLDLTMPRMGGVETFWAIRERLPHLPILFTSGYRSKAIDALPLGEPSVGFIQKPYQIAELHRALSDLMGKVETARA